MDKILALRTGRTGVETNTPNYHQIWEQLKERAEAYCSSFCDKIENDTLTWKEYAIFLIAGALIAQILIVLGIL